MEVLLINPASKVKTWASGYQVMPLGLGYLAACLEEERIAVEVLDLNINLMSDQELRKYLKKRKPKIVGLTATTPMVKTAWSLAKLIKGLLAVKIILGGPHASALPEESVQLPQIDFVVRNEGEKTFVELTKAILNKKSTDKVLGISFKRGNKVINNPQRPFIKNLDSLPLPARHLFPMDKYKPSQPLLSMRTPCANILTSRGCPFGCNFCFKGVFGRTFRTRSAESVLNEWEILIKDHKISEIEIVDDNSALDVPRLIKICQEIIKRGLVVPWATYSGVRVDHPDSLKLTKLMKKAGCYRVGFGIESGSDEILKKIEKRITTRQTKKAVKTAKKAGLTTIGFYMFGNIDETRETMQKTINFSEKLDTDFAQFTICTPFPGSSLYNQVLAKGKLLITDWNEFDNMGNQAFFEMKTVKKQDVEEMRAKAYKEFYLRPKILFRLAKNTIKHPEMLKFLAPRALSILKIK
jgi:radical SAM superfamily enzyme YgiQ (UPF0313 family)